jgi:hypothetical protein
MGEQQSVPEPKERMVEPTRTQEDADHNLVGMPALRWMELEKQSMVCNMQRFGTNVSGCNWVCTRAPKNRR